MPRPRRSRRAAAQPAADTAQTKPTPGFESDNDQDNPITTRLNAPEKRALEKSSGLRDDAIRRLSMEDTQTSSGADAGTGVNSGNDADANNNFDSSVEFGRKAAATPANMHHRQSRRDTTGLDLDDDVFGALEDSLDDEEPVKEAPASGQRSTDTSSLTASVFKRRGRAPSISLHGNDSAAIRPSSRAGVSTPLVSSSFNIGAFKRRAREPSILGTGRKERAQSAVDISSDAASSDDEGEDFAPEAESTPLNKRKTRTQPTVEAPQVEEKGDEQEEDEARVADEPAVTRPSTRSRKRKSTETEAGQEASERPEKSARSDDLEPPVANDGSDDDIPALAAANSDDESELSSLPSLPSPELPPLQRPQRPSTPINQSDVMAPPESSGSEDNEAWPGVRNLGKRQRHNAPGTPTRDGNVSDVSSPPSLTHSPNFSSTRRRQQAPRSKKKKSKSAPRMMTADLANLLPRRRQKKTAVDHDSDSEIDASGLAQDQDELGYIDARASKRRRGNGSNSKTATPATPATPKDERNSRMRRRTYGRRSSNKENDSDADGAEGDRSALSPMPDDTFDPVDDDEGNESMAEELKDAVKKFQEVDEWEMEFEETMHTSSPSAR